MSKYITGDEGSAYWNTINNRGGSEEKTANPDLLTELETLFPQAILTPEQEEQYSLYLRAIDKVRFSSQQKLMWNLFSLKCYTVTRIAQALGLDKSTVSRTLKVAIEKLKIECEKERRNEEKFKRDTSGFQKGITVKGSTDIDPLFHERMEKHASEIDAFYKEHPELKEGKKKKNEKI